MTFAHDTPALAGWYVISLRPRGGHAPLRRAAARLGARCFAISTLALEPLPCTDVLLRALQAPVVIATSPAAVRFATTRSTLQPRPGQRWLAVGPGTARALRNAGVHDVHYPLREHRSEGMLALPELDHLAGKQVGLLTAPGGRDVIAPALRERGANVQVAEVYQRRPLRVAPTRRHALSALPAASVLLVSSGEAFHSLWTQLDLHEQQALRCRPVVASSERLVSMLAGLGFPAPVRAGSAMPGHMLAAFADVGAPGLPVGCGG